MEEIPDGFDLFFEGRKPMIVRDDPTQPLPDALLGAQFRRVGRLSLEHEPSLGVPHDGLYGRAFLRCPPVMDDQQPFARMIRLYSLISQSLKTGVILLDRCRATEPLEYRVTCSAHVPFPWQ